MATVYLHQDAGYALTETHWGEDNDYPNAWYWTLEYGGTGVGYWTLWSEDGQVALWLVNTFPGSPY